MGSAPAAETSGGIGVGPGDIRRYLFIMRCWFLSYKIRVLNPDSLSRIVRIGYMNRLTFNKLLLSRAFLFRDSNLKRAMLGEECDDGLPLFGRCRICYTATIPGMRGCVERPGGA